jgi:glutamate carboxypeptidase
MDTHVARTLLDWLRDREAAMSDLLGQLVMAESPSSDATAQATMRALLQRELCGAGFRVRVLPGHATGDHLFAIPSTRARHAPFQLVVGHLDTVWPVGTVAQRPFEARDDRYVGPGTFDMKAGLVQAVYALRALSALCHLPTVTPVLFVNADEEIGSRSSTRWIRRLARLAVRAFVLEPAYGPGGALKTARKGVGQFTVHVRGRAAHAGINPEAGVSAILELSHQIQRLFALNDPEHGVTVNVGTIDGGLRPNVVAPEASAIVDVRVPSEAAGVRLEAAIRSLAPVQPGVTIQVEGGIERPPMEPTPRNQRLWQTALSAAGTLGLSLEQASVGGASDGNLTSQYTATLDGLGPVGDGAHATEEYVERGRLAERAALLALLVLSPPELPECGKGQSC